MGQRINWHATDWNCRVLESGYYLSGDPDQRQKFVEAIEPHIIKGHRIVVVSEKTGQGKK